MKNKPLKKDIRNALENSGYMLEHRICPLLEEFGYHTETNIQYEDIDTGKSCEFDVQATKMVMVDENHVDAISIILLISCKNNHSPVVAMTRKVILPTLVVAGRIVNLGTPLRVYKTDNDYESLEEHFKFNEFHHYHDNSYTATQYCIITPKKEHVKNQKGKVTYKADHGDLYSDIYKLFKVVDSQKKQDIWFREKVPTKLKEKNIRVDTVCYQIALIYPIMLFGGDLYECRLTGQKFSIFKNDHILLWQTISSTNIKGSLYIDMIKEEYLRKYLKLINQEMKEIRTRFHGETSLLRENALKEFRKKNPPPLSPPIIIKNDFDASQP